MYSCINRRRERPREREIISEHHVKKTRGKKRESNKTNHFGLRPRNNRLIVDDDTTRHTYWRKMVPTCIVYMCVCMDVCVPEMNYGSFFSRSFSSVLFDFFPSSVKCVLNNRRCVSLLTNNELREENPIDWWSLLFLAWFQRDADESDQSRRKLVELTRDFQKVFKRGRWVLLFLC